MARENIIYCIVSQKFSIIRNDNDNDFKSIIMKKWLDLIDSVHSAFCEINNQRRL